nr:putative ribonuclease H-like domain-containing protein [Tanacetum cinerariifolium]
EDVVIGSMIIKKVYYVKGLGHTLFSVGQFCDKGLEVAFQKSTCFVRNEDGVDFLTSDRSSNLYTIALNEVASNSSTCLLAKVSFSQTWLWHQCLSHLNFATINNLVKNNLVQGLPKMKFKKYHLCSACEQWKIYWKHHKSKTAFASNKPLYLLHMDLCGPMRVQSINGKRYVLVVVDDYSRYTWVFFLHSKDEASDVIISFIKKTQVNLQLQVQRVRTDNDVYLFNDYDDVGKLKAKGDIGVFVGYSKESAAFRIYNKRTRKIHESVNVNFDEISEMAIKQRREMFNNMCFFPYGLIGSKDPQNTDANATFKVNEPESEVHVSSSSSAKAKQHDGKTTREAKGKNPVELSSGVRNLSEEFEDFFDNSINGVNAASTSVRAVGQNSTNSTNTFSVTGPSNTVVSPTLGKSSYVDPSQYPNNPDMPAVEYITYSDDEKDGAEADFSNLEINITVSPIPTTRVHKDHHVIQIIGDLSSAPQSRSMTRMVKEQGEYSQWVERFMNYLEEQTDGEAMINSIKNGDQPLPRVTQVSIAGTTSTEQPPLKDKSMWSAQEKRVQKIDRMARSLLIQGLRMIFILSSIVTRLQKTYGMLLRGIC